MRIRAATAHHLLKAAVLIGFSLYIAFLAKTGGLPNYVGAGMASFVKVSSIAFSAMSVYQLFWGMKSLQGREEACDCGHDHGQHTFTFKSLLFYAMFCFPLLIGFFSR